MPVVFALATFAVMAKAKTTIGRTEYIALPKLGVVRVEAKMDTGAYRSALHYQKLLLRSTEGKGELVVTFAMGRKRTKVVFKRFTQVVVKSSTGQRTERYLISTPVKLNGFTVNTQFTLFDRSDMKHQVLLGRKFLRGRFVVDVERKRTLAKSGAQ
ncbi:MAG TPA: RimK/LysX family protein [Flavobacteriales bacterium]|nr:RimK/LysX family protein [Flavobacteriales bacterium]